MKTRTKEELDALWADMKALDKKREEERERMYSTMTEEEIKRLEEELSDPFYERISDNPLGGDDDDID